MRVVELTLRLSAAEVADIQAEIGRRYAHAADMWEKALKGGDMSFTDEPKKESAPHREFLARAAALRKDLNLPPVPDVDLEEVRRKARLEALREDVEEAERRVVRGAGTAFPVGSEMHDKAPGKASNLPGIPIGPINLPKLIERRVVEWHLDKSQLDGMVRRTANLTSGAESLDGYVLTYAFADELVDENMENAGVKLVLEYERPVE